MVKRVTFNYSFFTDGIRPADGLRYLHDFSKNWAYPITTSVSPWFVSFCFPFLLSSNVHFVKASEAEENWLSSEVDSRRTIRRASSAQASITSGWGGKQYLGFR